MKLATTSTVDDTLEPEWEETFLFSVCHKNVEDLLFEVSQLVPSPLCCVSQQLSAIVYCRTSKAML